MRGFTIGLFLLAGSGVFAGNIFAAEQAANALDNDARIAALIYPPARGWDNVEAIRAASEAAPTADAAGRFAGAGSELLLAPDGRMSMITRFDEHAEAPGTGRGTAAVGVWRQQGNMVDISFIDFALEPTDAVPTPEQIADFRTSLKEMAPYLMEENGETAPDETLPDVETAAADAPFDETAALDAYERSYASSQDGGRDAMRADPWNPEVASTARYLLLQQPDGALLLDANMLMWHAQRWEGEGAMELFASYWRASGPDSAYNKPRESESTFTLADPLHPGVPEELRKLLRTGVIEARVAAAVDPKTIEWSYHSASVPITLDRGEKDGLLETMSLYGAPPNEHLFATVTKVTPHTALAEIQINRFAPGDAPKLPEKGVVFASRTVSAIGCGIDTSAAVRGKITAVRPSSFGTDEDGFTFAELEIDQGSQHGLALDDRFEIESTDEEDRFWGEGRVRRVDATTATVLWRSQGAGSDEDLDDDAAGDPAVSSTLPTVGRHLVTPGWQRAELDVFGSVEAEASSPVMVD